jgi:hypothetical protein
VFEDEAECLMSSSKDLTRKYMDALAQAREGTFMELQLSHTWEKAAPLLRNRANLGKYLMKEVMQQVWTTTTKSPKSPTLSK